MHKLVLTFLLLLISSVAYAGDLHQDDQPHRVTYVITDSSGNPVAGETVNLALERGQDNYFLDFSDGTFKASGWTTRTVSMTYDTRGEHYYRMLTVDTATLVSGDYCVIISNDSVTYADQNTECFTIGQTDNIVKINR